MTWNNFTVQYHDGSSWVSLSDVLEITSSIGRRTASDPWTPSSTTVTVRYPTGFASPISDLQIGTWLRWISPNASTTFPSWTGVVRDVSVQWGIPYTSGVGVSDLLVISAEGHLGQWGRTSGDGLSVSAGFANGSIQFVAGQLGLEWNGNVTDEPVAASTVSGSALDWLNLVANTAQARVVDGHYNNTTKEPSIYVGRSNVPYVLSESFSDTANTSTKHSYDVLGFDSLADNYYTQIIVTSDGLAEQMATIGSAPFRTLTVATLASSTAQMQDIANYVLGTFDNQVVSVSQLSALSEAQVGNSLDNLGFAGFYYLPLCRVDIEFRGQTYYAIIEGVTMTANPSGARFTYYVTPQEFYSWLRLNDSVFGKLDNNKLGIY